MTGFITSEARASGGGPQAIGCLQAFEEELDYLYRTLRRQGVPDADVQDLAQDVFVVMWRRWAEFDQNRPVRPWLGAIACHLAIKHLTRRRREVQRPDADRLDETPLADDRLASARAQSLALRALAALPDRHRLALTLHELDGISVKELASLWSVPLFTAYTRLRAARRAFARVAARLQREAPRGSAVFLSSRTLLSRQKASSPAPAQVRARIQARIGVLLLTPEASWPAPHDVPRFPPPGKLAPVSVTALVLGSVAAVAILAVSITRSAADAGSAGVRRGAGLPVSTHAPSGSVLRPRGTPPPKLVAIAPPPEDTRDLLGRWNLDDEAGSSVARDSSGHRRDCLVRGPNVGSGWIAGVRGGALDISAGGWLECPLPDQADRPPAELTVAAWIEPGRLRAGVRAIASRARVLGHGEHFFFGLRSGKLRLYSTPWGVNIDHPLPRKPERWTHVAFTRGQDGLARLFVDGVEVVETPVNPRFRAKLIGPLRIGAGTQLKKRTSLASAPQLFGGSIDEVRVYQRALTSSELAALASRDLP